MSFNKKRYCGNCGCYRFSDISNNEVYSFSKIKSFDDADSGSYEIKDIDKIRELIPDSENIPLDEIGRTDSEM